VAQPQNAAVANLDVVGSVEEQQDLAVEENNTVAQPQDAAVTNLDVVERANVIRLVGEVVPGDVVSASMEDIQQWASTLEGRMIAAADQSQDPAIDFPSVDLVRHEFLDFGILITAVTDLLAQRRASLISDYEAAGGGDAAGSDSDGETGPGPADCVVCYEPAPVAIFCGRDGGDGCQGRQRLCMGCYGMCGNRCPTCRGHLQTLVGSQQLTCGNFGGLTRSGNPCRKAATNFDTGRCSHH